MKKSKHELEIEDYIDSLVWRLDSCPWTLTEFLTSSKIIEFRNKIELLENDTPLTVEEYLELKHIHQII